MLLTHHSPRRWLYARGATPLKLDPQFEGYDARETLSGNGQALAIFTNAARAGGPDRFSRTLGFEYLIDKHRHLNITDEQRDRFISAYLESLDEADLPTDERFRKAVQEHVEFGAHVAQQNSQAQTDAELNPIREVPIWSW